MLLNFSPEIILNFYYQMNIFYNSSYHKTLINISIINLIWYMTIDLIFKFLKKCLNFSFVEDINIIKLHKQ